MVNLPGLKFLLIQVSLLYGVTVGMWEESRYCTNAECLVLVNTYWRNYNGPLLFSFSAEVQYLLSMNTEAGARRPSGSDVTYHLLGRVRRCRSGRWPSCRCSNGRCFWELGYCSDGMQTELLHRRYGSTVPKVPRTPSYRGLKPEIYGTVGGEDIIHM